MIKRTLVFYEVAVLTEKKSQKMLNFNITWMITKAKIPVDSFFSN